MIDPFKIIQNRPPPGAEWWETILWILTHPLAWGSLLMEYLIPLIIFTIIGIVLFYILRWVSKYYILKEIYFQDPEDNSMRRYWGRQIIFAKKGGIFSRFVPRNPEIKGVMMTKKGLKGKPIRIILTKDIKFRELPTRTVIFARGVKKDYRLKGCVPTNDIIDAIHASESVFYDEIDKKIEETDDKVSKSVRCNSETQRTQLLTGSIPLSASYTTKEEESRRLTKIIPTKIPEFREKKKVKPIEYSVDDALSELRGAEVYE